MRKAANILYLIGAIMSFAGTAIFLVAGIIFIVYCSPGLTQSIIDGLNNGTITSDFVGTTEEVAAQIQNLFLVLGFLFLSCSLFGIVGGIFALLAYKKPTRKLAILNIVFGVLSGSSSSGINPSVVAGILTLIADSREKK